MVFLSPRNIPEPFAIVMASILGLTFTAGVVLFFSGVIHGTTIPRLLGNARLTQAQRAILDTYFYYYNTMSDKRFKARFRLRVALFIRIKQFIPMGGLTAVNEEMKVLIAASATQLAFGHRNVFYMHFRRIYVFPAEFTLPDSPEIYDGKVNLKGGIALSWRSFLTGYKYPEDGKNLGLHEMAHALYFENAYKNREYNFLNRRALIRFAVLAKKEMLEMNEGNAHFFRDYAAKNRHEFFAVAVESFFERAVDFKQYHPALYKTMCAILNQDPAEKKYTGTVSGKSFFL